MQDRLIRWLMAVLLVAIPLAAGCQTDQRPTISTSGQAVPVVILRRYSGSDWGLKNPQVRLIQSRQQLIATGSVELAQQPIDFGLESIVLVALGEQPTSGYWARIDAVELHGDTLKVRGTANRPDDHDIVAQVLTYPYGAAVIGKLEVHTLQNDIESVQGLPAPHGS